MKGDQGCAKGKKGGSGAAGIIGTDCILLRHCKARLDSFVRALSACCILSKVTTGIKKKKIVSMTHHHALACCLPAPLRYKWTMTRRLCAQRSNHRVPYCRVSSIIVTPLLTQ